METIEKNTAMLKELGLVNNLESPKPVLAKVLVANRSAKITQ